MNQRQEQGHESQLILLVDDDVAITEGLAAALERQGRTIITCNDLESAQLIVTRMHPSHIVTDVRLSGPFGFEGLDFIRYAKRHSPDSRIILITGDAPEALQLEASERGAVAFLQKPFEAQALEATINLLVSSALTAGAADHQRIIRMPLFDEIIAGDSLHPFFQPVVTLDGTFDPVGYEALARLRSDSPLRNPDVLFDYASRKHRLLDLETACIKGALRDGVMLATRGPLFLNIHPSVLSGRIMLRDVVISAAERSGVPLNRIVLELTEQGSLTDDKRVLDNVTGLQKVGVRFAFDDVGMAYSHLPFMDKIRPAFLKISQHFGTDFETDPTKTKLVMNILSLARDFDCVLILEGIERKSTAEAAMELKIPLGQGFFFGRPAEASKFLKGT